MKISDILNEDAPPDPEIEDWIQKNKSKFIEQYGEEKGMEVLYSTAWKKYKEKQ